MSLPTPQLMKGELCPKSIHSSGNIPLHQQPSAGLSTEHQPVSLPLLPRLFISCDSNIRSDQSLMLKTWQLCSFNMLNERQQFSSWHRRRHTVNGNKPPTWPLFSLQPAHPNFTIHLGFSFYSLNAITSFIFLNCFWLSNTHSGRWPCHPLNSGRAVALASPGNLLNMHILLVPRPRLA